MSVLEVSLVSYFGDKEEYSPFNLNLLVELDLITKKDAKIFLIKQYLKIRDNFKKGPRDYLLSILEKDNNVNYNRKLHNVYRLNYNDVNNIFNVLTQNDPKINTLILYGPSNAGKSLLARSLLNRFSPGSIQRDGGTNVHWLENTLYKSFILWEEPIINCDTKEDVKLIMGGEKHIVNPKNKPLLYKEDRTPLIITTNIPFWLNDYTNAMLNRAHLICLNNKVENFIKDYINSDDIIGYLLDIYKSGAST